MEGVSFTFEDLKDLIVGGESKKSAMAESAYKFEIPAEVMEMITDLEVPLIWSNYYNQFESTNEQRLPLYQRVIASDSPVEGDTDVSGGNGSELNPFDLEMDEMDSDSCSSDLNSELGDILSGYETSSSGYSSLRTSSTSSSRSVSPVEIKKSPAWLKFVTSPTLPAPGTPEYIEFFPFRDTILGERERLLRDKSLYQRLYDHTKGFTIPPPIIFKRKSYHS